MRRDRAVEEAEERLFRAQEARRADGAISRMLHGNAFPRPFPTRLVVTLLVIAAALAGVLVYVNV